MPIKRRLEDGHNRRDAWQSVPFNKQMAKLYKISMMLTLVVSTFAPAS